MQYMLTQAEWKSEPINLHLTPSAPPSSHWAYSFTLVFLCREGGSRLKHGTGTALWESIYLR